MLYIFLATALSKYFGDGPVWPEDGFEPNCEETWWSNLLYINNFYKTDKGVYI